MMELSNILNHFKYLKEGEMIEIGHYTRILKRNDKIFAHMYVKDLEHRQIMICEYTPLNLLCKINNLIK